MNVADAIAQTALLLADHGIPDPRREAASLVSLSTGKDKTFLIAHPEHSLDATELFRLDEFARRRAGREPLQYIRGDQEFFGLDFIVSPEVLIPRPETETLVEKAIEILAPIDSPTFFELGVGSGCISVAILANNPNARAVAVDISTCALALADLNARRLNVGDRLTLVESDLYAGIGACSFNLIVSNPPYISSAEMNTLQPEVREFEPRSALTDGGDGLSIIRRITSDANRFLKPDGKILIEIGSGQSAAISAMFNAEVWQNTVFLPDLQGIPRVVFSRLREG
ncbi:MAG: peptide chain release factor N(5)-glutamine methyltransferase [Acidobacteriota bacterium]